LQSPRNVLSGFFNPKHLPWLNIFIVAKITILITTDRQNLNFVGFYFYLFVYQLLAVFIFVLLKTYPLSK